MTPEQKELIREGEILESVLGGDKRGDPETMSDAIRYLIRVNRTQQYSEFVTGEQCLARMAACPGTKPAPVISAWTWSKTAAVLGSVAMLVGLALKLWG